MSSGCDYAGALEYAVTIGAQSGLGWLHIDALPTGVTDVIEFHMGTITVAGVRRSVGGAWAYPDDGPQGMTITSGYGIWVTPAWTAVPVEGQSAIVRRGCTRYANACEIVYDNLTHHQGVRYPPLGP